MPPQNNPTASGKARPWEVSRLLADHTITVAGRAVWLRDAYDLATAEIARLEAIASGEPRSDEPGEPVPKRFT